MTPKKLLLQVHYRDTFFWTCFAHFAKGKSLRKSGIIWKNEHNLGKKRALLKKKSFHTVKLQPSAKTNMTRLRGNLPLSLAMNSQNNVFMQ